MELKVLFIEDDERLGQGLKKYFNGITLSGYICLLYTSDAADE